MMRFVLAMIVAFLWGTPAYGQFTQDQYVPLNTGDTHYVNDEWGSVGYAYNGNGLFSRIIAPHPNAASLTIYANFSAGSGRVYVLYKIRKDMPGIRVVDAELTQTGAVTIPNPSGYYQVGVENCLSSCSIYIDYRQGPFYK